MTIVVVGVVADTLGAVAQWETIAANHPGRNFDTRRVFSSAPSSEYRSVHAAEIRVDVDHARPIGAVKYLELSKNGKLHAVAEIEASGLGDGPFYYSPVEVFCAKALAGLGPLPGTLASRCVRIELKRRRRDEPVDDFIPTDFLDETVALKAEFEEWGCFAVELATWNVFHQGRRAP